MGAEKSKPVGVDDGEGSKNADEEDPQAVADRRRAKVQQAGKARMSVIAMSGGYNDDPDRGPVAGFLPGAPSLHSTHSRRDLPPDLVPSESAGPVAGFLPGAPSLKSAHSRRDVPTESKAAASGFQAGAALGLGAGVMKDPPKNVFGPGHVVSPDMYPEFHRTGGYDRFLLTFSKLEAEERVSCFETLVHFQGKMGLMIRQCDQFCEAQDMYDLFCQMRDVCEAVLDLPHARLWLIDRERNSVLCLYNNSAEDVQNGRLLPILGSFPGEVARSRKVVICNDATSDSRFQSWQYREMQDATNEPLGTIIGVALLDAEEKCKYVFECYRPEPAISGAANSGPPCLDGADAFLLQTIGDYAGAAAVAIRQRWEQIRVAQLPAILLASHSLDGFLSRLREFLKEWFGVLDGAPNPKPNPKISTSSTP